MLSLSKHCSLVEMEPLERAALRHAQGERFFRWFYINHNKPFMLSLSKHCTLVEIKPHEEQPLDKLRANGFRWFYITCVLPP